jgi:serine/threonine protein kinase
MIGKVVGNYRIERKLGEGGMGAVYQGVDMMLEREVAIKVLRPELASQPQVVERFRSEAVTLAKLNHPNIATLYSFFRQGDDFFMVLEFVRGETLDSVIASRGAMGSERAIPLFCQALDGIDHAHRYGIIHRDIKPANMMLTENSGLKVLDFGIARILGTSRMTKAGHLIGTIEYMSPEQVKGLDTDARSDIYSLGMLLYEMLTGRTPFQIENEFELMRAQIEQMPSAPRTINPEISEAVEAAIMRAIAKNPAERFQTAGEFRQTLLSAGYGISSPLDVKGLQPDLSRMTRPLVSYPGINSNPPMNSPYSSSPSSSPGSQPTVSASPPVMDFGAATIVDPKMQSSSAPTQISKGDAATEIGAAETVSGDLKETRIGTAADVAAPRHALQPTRVATPAEAINVAPAKTAAANVAPQTSGSFFDKLTWKHYVGGAVAAMLAVGVVLFVGIAILLKGAGGNAKTNDKSKPAVETAKPVEPATTTVNSGQSGAAQTSVPSNSTPGQVDSDNEVKISPPADAETSKPSESRANASSQAKTRAPQQREAAAPRQPQPRKDNKSSRDKRELDELLRMH